MTKRKDYITVLNVLSALAVVYLHANTFWEYSSEPIWVLSNVIECLFYFAVPVFFMITGATLLGYRNRNTTKQFFKKRFEKTVIPFIFWSIFSLLFSIALQAFLYGIDSVHYSVLDIINAFTNSKYLYNPIYWYFPALFTVYMSIPVLSAIDENKKKSVYRYIIIGSFVVNTVLPFVTSLTRGKIGYSGSFYFAMGIEHIQYLVIGYYIDNYEIKKSHRMAIYAAGIAGLLVHFFGTWWLTARNGDISMLFKGYTGAPAVIYSVAIFLLFKNINYDKVPKLIMNTVSFFRNQTFGVYLIHYFIVVLINISGFVNINSVFYKLLAPIVIFVMSSFIIKVMQKIPAIKKIVP